MTQIYSQLPVSCGLSAILNALQPDDMQISPTQTLGDCLDRQWLRLTWNETPENPLVILATRREWKWVLVLDYILLRKIRSSFLLCRGIPLDALQIEMDEEYLPWVTLKPVFLTIITRLERRTQDWPLWHYHGELRYVERRWEDMTYRHACKRMVQRIKSFYEMYRSEIEWGPIAEWKAIFENIPSGFHQGIAAEDIAFHIDFYKTTFELAELLDTLGYEWNFSSGNQYPTHRAQHGLVLILRPGHWVAEHPHQRRIVLDSLTQSTDAMDESDSYYHFQPKENFGRLCQTLIALENLFPHPEILPPPRNVPPSMQRFKDRRIPNGSVE